MHRLFVFVICIICLIPAVVALPSCEGDAAGAGEGEGEGEAGEGEGEVAEGEGEGEAPAGISYVFERDGAEIAGDVLDLGTVDTSNGGVDVALGLKNTGDADFTI